ncbi:MAG TPA: respiratory nitrate reductase subunit gamma [Bacillota bacterium]|nr:respiratory nitrate reductase subunit gamma [Bacillota bacterium]
MNLWNQFWWVIYPYLALVILILGTWQRFSQDPYSITAKSSELLEKKYLRYGSMLFHYGIVFVFGGHVMGLLIPKSVHEALGITDELYHMMAIGIGGIAGVATLLGALFLFVRRFTNPRISKTSSVGDKWVLILILILMFTGMSATSTNALGHTGFDYRTSIAPWIRGVLTLSPDTSYMQNVPFIFQVHVICAISFFIFLPFTRLIHILTLPLHYLTRSFVLFRRRGV